MPHLEPVPLPRGATLYGAGDPERCLYFVTAGIVSRFFVTESGASLGFAVTGREGVIGLASFLGGDTTPSQAVVLSPGYAYRLPASVLYREFEHDSPLRRVLLSYLRALFTQIGQIAACNRHHTVERRFCCWILLCLDRLPSNELGMTQALIAHMLGVRREGVTVVAGRMQKAGFIEYHRGIVTVLDRIGLESQACECYAVIRRAYDQLLPGDDRMGHPDHHGQRHPHPPGRGECDEHAHAGST